MRQGFNKRCQEFLRALKGAIRSPLIPMSYLPSICCHGRGREFEPRRPRLRKHKTYKRFLGTRQSKKQYLGHAATGSVVCIAGRVERMPSKFGAFACRGLPPGMFSRAPAQPTEYSSSFSALDDLIRSCALIDARKRTPSLTTPGTILSGRRQAVCAKACCSMSTSQPKPSPERACDDHHTTGSWLQ